jgi:hypothetical protein
MTLAIIILNNVDPDSGTDAGANGAGAKDGGVGCVCLYNHMINSMMPPKKHIPNNILNGLVSLLFL